MKILLTAFGDYSKPDGTEVTHNPSEESLKFYIKHHAFAWTSEHELVSLVLSGTDKKLAESALMDCLNTFQPDVCVSLGMKTAGTECLLLEQFATNIATQERVKSPINLDKLADILTHEGINTQLSKDAGTGTCNHIYSVALKYCPAIFIHTPCVENTKINGQSPHLKPMAVRQLSKGIDVVLGFLATQNI